MSTYDKYLSENDNSISAFRDSVEKRVVSYINEGDDVRKEGKVTDGKWKVFNDAKASLINDLEEVKIQIIRKIPTRQNEDTFGHEVQEHVIGVIGKHLAKLKGADKEANFIVSHTAYLSELCAFHKAKKDRPDSYPSELDQVQLAAIESSWVNSVSYSYQQMKTIVIEVGTLLQRNNELINKPKRTYNTMM